MGSRSGAPTASYGASSARGRRCEWLSHLTLDLQDDGDFAIDAARSLVCLRLQDRNSNMASVVLDVRVDLRTHAVERWLLVGEEGL